MLDVRAISSLFYYRRHLYLEAHAAAWGGHLVGPVEQVVEDLEPPEVARAAVWCRGGKGADLARQRRP
jgi:hypothetical protein